MKIQGIQARPKEWAWSYSKLKNYESCPKRHYEVDLVKNFNDLIDPVTGKENEFIAEGNKAHAALAAACQGGSLPTNYSHFQRWVDLVVSGPGQLLVEQKYAITRDFNPTTYFARDVWYRGIGDVVRLNGRAALVLDWKTGKIAEDSVQLALMAACIFAHYPTIDVVRSEFIWLKEECSTPELFKRSPSVPIEATVMADVWSELLPRVDRLETAAKKLDYPPKPGPFCMKFCPVQSCPFWRKGSRR